MYLQKTTSNKGSKTYYSYLVRQSFRTDKGPRSRTVANVTHLPEEARNALDLALKGKKLVPFEELVLANALDFGGLAVLHDAWNRFGLDGIFGDVASKRHRALLKALVLARLLFPCSKLALADQARGTLLAAACGLDQAKESFDEDDLYAAMDALNGRWVPIEKQLFTKGVSKPLHVVLYDLTSVYFTGKGPQPLACYGYSRDHRSDRPQVVLAIATDSDGIPIHIEVLKGNRGDSSTLQGLLITLRRRFGIGDTASPARPPQEVIFAFDGGIASRVNLAAIEADKLSYVTRLSKKQLGALLKKLPQDDEPELFDCTEVIEFELDGVRYVVAGGEMRRYRDQMRRQARIAEAHAALTELATVKRENVNAQKLASQAGRLLQRQKAHQYFDYWVDDDGQLRFECKQAVINEEARLDGWYLLRTNIPSESASKEEVLAHYKKLIEVEHAFRELKTYLEVRPIYHYRPDRVRNHIRICFLAYWLSARLSQEWTALGVTRRVPELLRTLQQIRLGFLKVDAKPIGSLFTQIPANLNATLGQLDLLELFSKPPAWVVV